MHLLLLSAQGSLPCDPVFQRIAEEYSVNQLRHNNPSRTEEVAIYASLGEKGEVPYWDVDPKEHQISLYGNAQTPFRTAGGKIRLYSHYADTALLNHLKENLGAPTGTMPARLQSSIRTVMVFPEEGAPFQLKFTGERVRQNSKKLLSPEEIRVAVARSEDLGSHPNYLGEPSGLTVQIGRGKKMELNILYRESHFSEPVRKDLAPTDSLLVLHTAEDPKFLETPAAKKMFAERDLAQWWERELSPKLGSLIGTALFDVGAHPELHAQNVDLLVSEKGSIKHLFIKDLSDQVEDLMLRLAIGRSLEKVSTLRGDGFMNEVGLEKSVPDIGQGVAIARRHTVKGAYGVTFGQVSGSAALRFPANAKEIDRNLIKGLKDKLNEKIKERGFDTKEIEKYAEHQLLENSALSPPEAIAAARELFIKLAIAKNFTRSDAAASAFVGSETGFIVSSGLDTLSGSVKRLDRSKWSHGYFHGFPIALELGPKGEIKSYVLLSSMAGP